MKSFIANPLEYILNKFGYTARVKRTAIFDHIMRTTDNTWTKRIQDNGNVDRYSYTLYSPTPVFLTKKK